MVHVIIIKNIYITTVDLVQYLIILKILHKRMPAAMK